MLKIKVGDKAPEFCLPDKDENNICLKNYKGKWVVLYFYPKDNTSGCTIEAIDFTSSLPEFSKLGAVVIGASPDSPKSHQKFIDKHELKKRSNMYIRLPYELSLLFRCVAAWLSLR